MQIGPNLLLQIAPQPDDLLFSFLEHNIMLCPSYLL